MNEDPDGTEHRAPEPITPRAAGPAVDHVAQRRARLLRLTSAGQRIGYGCFGLAMVLLVVALATQLPTWLVTTIVVLMLAGSVVLLPAIILSYGAKAAEKDERGEPFRY